MSVQIQSYTVYLGEDAKIPFTLSPTADITGQTFEFVMSDYPGAPELLSLTSQGGGITITSAGTGTMTINLLAATQAGVPLTERYYSWDLFRTNSGYRQRVGGGVLLMRATPNLYP